MNLPSDIKELFFETLHGDKSIPEFEQWLYADKRLEGLLTPEDYLDLISFGYKGEGVKYELTKLLEKHINKGEYEQWKLFRLLRKALQRDSDLPHILMTFYDLYCRGYYFLDNLGLVYGLAVEVPYGQANSWEELTPEQQQDLLNSFYPGLEEEIKRVIGWLENGKVVLTGVLGEDNHYEYIDNRTEAERSPTAYQVSPADTTNTDENATGEKSRKDQKPWWKFW